MWAIKMEQYELIEQWHLLIENQCAENKQVLEEQQQTLAQQQHVKTECVQKAKPNKWGRHLISPNGKGVVSGEPFRTPSISFTTSTEEILWYYLKRIKNLLKQRN